MSNNDLYMAGKMLVAMPSMSDSRFHKSVIFICAHDDKGAMGLVINKEMDGIDLQELLDQLDLDGLDNASLSHIGPGILSGGPVEMARGFMLHSSEFQQKETVRINDDFSLTGTVSALKEVLKGQGPDHLLFALGYAGWSAGQLDQELKQNAWLAVDADKDLVFNIALDMKWDKAIKKIGIDPSMLSAEGGSA